MKVIGTGGKEYTIEPRANLSKAHLVGADLRGANLSKANLVHADLSGADLADANLSEANLMDTNFSNANLSKASLKGAVWNDETVFPEGFEIPEMSGTLDWQDGGCDS